MAAVMIGVDPHKASHAAVAVSPAEEQLGQLRVRRAGPRRRNGCWNGPQPGRNGPGQSRAPQASGRGLPALAVLSYLGCRAQASGCAQGTAEALPRLVTVLGCSGFGMQLPGGLQLPGGALPLGVGQHVALPFTGEFPADVRVYEHRLLLSALTCGR